MPPQTNDTPAPRKLTLTFQLPAELVYEFRAFVKRLGFGGIGDHVAGAMVRYMDDPPTLPTHRTNQPHGTPTASNQ